MGFCVTTTAFTNVMRKLTSHLVQVSVQRRKYDKIVSRKNSAYRYRAVYRTRSQFLTTIGKFFTFLAVIVLFPPKQTVHALPSEMTLNSYGVRPIKPGDTAMVFYANVSHTGNDVNSLLAARLRMEKCCYKIPSSNASNCDSMKLISGLGIVFHSKETRVLSMFFVNYDLFDREGSCTLSLLTKSSEPKEQAWEIGQELTFNFKTVLPKPGLLKKLFSGSSKGYRICNTDNYNALHECSNYDDCLIRYSGGRSLFNKDSSECETTPKCENSATNFLSIVTYKCEKSHDIDLVRKSFSPEMKQVDPQDPSNAVAFSGRTHHLSTTINKVNRSLVRPTPTVVCEHGIHTTGKDGKPNCTCFPGWRSLTLLEWEHKGGVVDSTEEGLPFHHMCTVPLMDPKTRGYLILAFVLVCITIPFIALVMCNRFTSEHHKKTLPRRSNSNEKILQENSPPSSTEDDRGDNTDDEADEERRFISKKSTRKQIDDMEEEEADRVISEIANRREPTLSRMPSQGDNADDNAPPPPPSMANTLLLENKASQVSLTQEDKASNTPSKSNPYIYGNSKDSSSHQSMPKPPSTALSTSTALRKPPPSPKSSIKKTISKQQQQLQQKAYFAPSRGFDLRQDEEEDIQGNFIRQVATQAPSMDDLLTMDNNEKRTAHVPMSPETGEEQGISVVVANCATVELRNNNLILHSMSSEEITQRKKDEWAEYLQCVSEETLVPSPVQLKSSHCSISMEQRQPFEKTSLYPDKKCGEDEDEQFGTKHVNKFPDFHYFHKDHKPPAMKVQSVPGMMQYHPFSSSFTSEPLSNEETGGLPQPPPYFFQRAFGAMHTGDLENRQECYRILSSLSHERLSSQEGGIRGTNSIWSNIASENTKEPSATPATTTPGSKVVTSCEEALENEDNKMTIRTNTIYGDMGSDADSEGALEEMASSSLPSDSQRYERGPESEILAEQPVEDNNRTVYGVSPQRPAMSSSSQQANENCDERPYHLINQALLESDLIPSDVYATDSAESTSIATQSMSASEFWKTITRFSLAGSGVLGGSSSDSTCDVTQQKPKPQVTTDYRIKSSLETALKAGRSQSATNLF